jgi:hypothetical protein
MTSTSIRWSSLQFSFSRSGIKPTLSSGKIPENTRITRRLAPRLSQGALRCHCHNRPLQYQSLQSATTANGLGDTMGQLTPDTWTRSTANFGARTMLAYHRVCCSWMFLDVPDLKHEYTIGYDKLSQITVYG